MKKRRLGTGVDIFKFSKTGNHLKTYNGATECSLDLNIHRTMVYKAIKNYSLIRGLYYLSDTRNFSVNEIIFTINKSTVECNHTIEDFTIISKYSKNLLVTLQMEHHKLQPQDIQSILTELINCNNYIS